MNVFKAIYHDGLVELLEKPETETMMEVLIVMPDYKKVKTLRGCMTSTEPLADQAIADELSKLSRKSESHLLEEADS